MAAGQNFVSISRRPPDVEDYIDMFRRYRSWIIGPMFGGLVLAVVGAFLWPDTYVSTAVMRIVPQQVSEKLVPSVVSTMMAERLQQMQTEILSRSTLADLIHRPSLDLYKKERNRLPEEDIIQEMRNKYVKIQPLAVPGEMGPNRYASAFAISFYYTDPYKAQAVVRELVTKFTEQNVTVQKNQAAATTNFLSDELKSAKDKMDQINSAITKFQTENRGKLPDEFQGNLQGMTNLQIRLSNIDDAINRAQQDKLMLETALSTVKQRQTSASNNLEQVLPGQAAVRNQRLINLEGLLTEQRSTLASLRKIYGQNYPDIATVQARISTLDAEKRELEKEEAERESLATAGPLKVTNPQVQSQIEDLKAQQATTQAAITAKDLEIQDKTRQEAELNRQIAALQARIEAAPANQQQYAALLQEQALAKQEYEDFKKKIQASETAQNLEEHKAGETLEVLDPASLPESPTEPNRLAWAAVGLGFGLMVGIVLAGAKEVKNTSLKNLKDVRAYTNLPVLSSVPLLENALLVRRKRRLFWLAWTSAVMIGTIAMSGSMYYYFFGRK